MIRALIVDDEPIARETIRLILAAELDVEVVGACSGVDAVAQHAALRPDVIFLDVQMPEVGGFDVVAAIGPVAAPAIVFVTAYDEHAVRAFEVHALDYVVKPFDDRRLRAALGRVRERLARGGRAWIQRFFVRGRDKTVVVAAADVDWLEAADDHVELHAGGAVHVLRERLAELEHRLDPARFVRIHRSTIVNLERVRELHPLFRGDALVVLAGGATLRLSRSRRAEFERRLSGSPPPADDSPTRR